MRMGKFDSCKIEGIGNIHGETNITCKLVFKNMKHIV